MEHTCRRCGCSSFHYNRSRMRMECDSCGTPVVDLQQDQRLMQYDRSYSQAMDHLAAGNWSQAIAILKPLLEQFPTEKRVYIAIFRSATQDYSDIEVANITNRSIASDAWDKLLRLNGVTGEMIRYSRKRHKKYRSELNAMLNKILLWIFLAALCSIVAGICIGIEQYFLTVLCTGGLLFCLYKLIVSKPIRVISQHIKTTPDYKDNPFV